MKVIRTIELHIWNSRSSSSLIPDAGKEPLQDEATKIVNAQIAEGYREGRFNLEVEECPDETFTCGWSVRQTIEE